jgi:hypothetical protein
MQSPRSIFKTRAQLLDPLRPRLGALDNRPARNAIPDLEAQAAAPADNTAIVSLSTRTRLLHVGQRKSSSRRH